VFPPFGCAVASKSTVSELRLDESSTSSEIKHKVNSTIMEFVFKLLENPHEH
jgi:hypothetical protein